MNSYSCFSLLKGLQSSSKDSMRFAAIWSNLVAELLGGGNVFSRWRKRSLKWYWVPGVLLSVIVKYLFALFNLKHFSREHIWIEYFRVQTDCSARDLMWATPLTLTTSYTYLLPEWQDSQPGACGVVQYEHSPDTKINCVSLGHFFAAELVKSTLRLLCSVYYLSEKGRP